MIFLLILLIQKLSSYSQNIDPDGHNIFYYENGAIASEGDFAGGKPNGVWKTYYPDGTLKSIGSKNAGLSDSTWLFYDNQGRLNWVYVYQNDVKNGCAQHFDTLGYLVEEFFYVNGVIQGEKITYYSSGAIHKTINYENGKETGLALEYDPTGIVITEEIYDNGFLKNRTEYNRLDERGQKTGLWRTYYVDGTIQSESSYRNGEKFGVSKQYNVKGKLIDMQDMLTDSTSTRTDLVLLDTYKEYYPGGQLKLVGAMDQGYKTGVFRMYDEAGNIVNGYIYQKDTLVSEGLILFDGTYEGNWTDYYGNGKVRSQGVYKQGIRSDNWTWYYPNGKIEQTGKFRSDQPFGTWTWYYPNGQTKRIENYNAYGKLEGAMVEYDSLGNEITRGSYYDGLQDGEWFYQVGDHRESGQFVVGQPDGIWTHYYLNGKIAFTGEFDEGTPKGKHTWYHQNGMRKMSGKYVGGVKNGIWRQYDLMGEVIEEILYKNGEIVKINGFAVEPADKYIP